MKWFTYCNHPAKPYRNYKDYGRAVEAAKRAYGFVFSSDDEEEELTHASLQALCASPELKRLYPRGYYVFPSDKDFTDLVVSDHILYAPLPNQGKLDTPPFYMVTATGSVIELSLRERYNNCRSLLKAVGCLECPEREHTCWSREKPEIPAEERPVSTVVPIDYLIETLGLKHKKTVIAGFTFASPMATKSKSFARAVRPFNDHDFSNIEDFTEERRKAARKAAANKKFRKTACTVCPIQEACNEWRWCRGPLPSAQQMTQETLDTWAGRLQQLPWPAWQFWTMARMAGTRGKWSRCHAALGGPHWDGSKWRAEVWRTKTRIFRFENKQDYDVLAEVFSLPRTEEHARRLNLATAPDDPQLLALWLLSQTVRYGPRIKGWGHSHNHELAWRTLEPHHLELQWASPHYLSRTSTVKTYADFYDCTDRQLPFNKKEVR